MGLKPRRKCASIGGAGSPHHCSPPYVLEAVRHYAQGQIALDPAGNPKSIVNAAVEFWGPRTRNAAHRVDGLAVRWFVDPGITRAKRSLWYLNPPYTRHEVDLWVAKAYCEGEMGPLEGIGLLPARTSAAWFRYCYPPRADALCFLNRRVPFLDAESAPAWESVLVYWGPTPVDFRDAMYEAGVAAKVFLR